MNLLEIFNRGKSKLEALYAEKSRYCFNSFKLALNIYRMFFANEKVRVRDVMKRFNIARRTALYRLKELEEAGLILVKLGRGGYYYLNIDVLLKPTKKVQAYFKPQPPTPPNKDNIYIYNNKLAKRTENISIIPSFFIKICNKLNSIPIFEAEAERKYLGKLQYNIIYAGATTGIVYDNVFSLYIQKRFGIAEKRLEKHLERFCAWLFYKDNHIKMKLKCFQKVVGLFISFLKKDIEQLKRYYDTLLAIQQKLREERLAPARNNQNRQRCTSPMSIAEILYSSFGDIVGLDRSCVSLNWKTA